MATVTRENIGTLHDKITVKLSKEDYMPSFEKSLKQYARNVNIPGFRKGMVPNAMIRKMYGQSLYNDEVLRMAGNKLETYLRDENLAIFAQPMVLPGETLNLDMNAPGDVDFSFEVGLKPEFEIPAIKEKAPLTLYKIEVSDKMLDDELERIRRRYGKVEDQEVVSSGDDIIYAFYEPVDASGQVAEDTDKKEDTVLFEKLPVKMQELLQGKKAEDSIVFVPAEIASGEELTAFLKDPLKATEDQAQQQYRMTLTKVGRLIPHELDETLFAAVFPNDQVTSEADFKERIKAELGKEYERISRERFNNEIYELLVHQTPVTFPVAFLKRWLKEGQENPKSEAEVEQEFPSFDHQLRWTLISDKLILEHDINVSREEVLDDIKGRVLSYFGMQADEDVDWLAGYMAKVEKDEKTVNETYRRLLFDKLFAFLQTQFTVTEAAISEEEFFKLPDAHAAHHHHH